ncbi:MAG: tetratricopeptide repeat protein [Proteobacteria bacterium]|nr:tetratricopeptide repeat protein [Pseudomonadota bacterium]
MHNYLQSEKKSWSIPHILLLITATIAVFLNSFGGGFTYDDYDLIVNNKSIRYWHFWDLWEITGRSTRTLSLMLDYSLFGESKNGYIIQNIFWHLFSSILLYLLSLKLLDNKTASFFTALIFALHPIHVEAVANIANRKEALCMTFSILSLLLYIKFLKGGGNYNYLYLFTSILAFYLALNSKQIALALPLCAAAYEYLYIEKEKRFITRRPTIFILLLSASAFIVYIFKVKGVDFVKGGALNDYDSISAAMHSPAALSHHLSLLFLPINLSPDYLIKLPEAGEKTALFIPWAVAIALSASLFLVAKKNRAIAFGLLWGLFYYIPVSSAIPETYFVADRYMYTPSAGIFIAITEAVMIAYRRINPTKARPLPGLYLTLSIAALLLLAALTLLNNSRWTDEISLWSQQIRLYPDYAYKGYYNRAVAYKKISRYDDSLADFSKAIEIMQEEPETYYERGIVFSMTNNYNAAIIDFSKTIMIDPNHLKAYNNRGSLYAMTKQYKKAIKDFKKILEMDEDNLFAKKNLVMIYSDTGDIAKATLYRKKISRTAR